MLYTHSKDPALTKELFENPGSEYRCTPFWAWNAKLEKEELLRQIEVFKEMGMGGFHMHSRSGMATHYLSEDFMDLVKACRDKAIDENMLCWLYDEDRWPSGAAGGIVTKEQKHRQKYLTLTPEVNEKAEISTVILPGKNSFSDVKNAITACAEAGKCYLLAVYDVVLDADGYLQKGKMISPDAVAEGNKWYAYVYTARSTGRFNGQAYADTLDYILVMRRIYGGNNDVIGLCIAEHLIKVIIHLDSAVILAANFASFGYGIIDSDDARDIGNVS